MFFFFSFPFLSLFIGSGRHIHSRTSDLGCRSCCIYMYIYAEKIHRWTRYIPQFHIWPHCTHTHWQCNYSVKCGLLWYKLVDCVLQFSCMYATPTQGFISIDALTRFVGEVYHRVGRLCMWGWHGHAICSNTNRSLDNSAKTTAIKPSYSECSVTTKTFKVASNHRGSTKLEFIQNCQIVHLLLFQMGYLNTAVGTHCGFSTIS